MSEWPEPFVPRRSEALLLSRQKATVTPGEGHANIGPLRRQDARFATVAAPARHWDAARYQRGQHADTELEHLTTGPWSGELPDQQLTGKRTAHARRKDADATNRLSAFPGRLPQTFFR